MTIVDWECPFCDWSTSMYEVPKRAKREPYENERTPQWVAHHHVATEHGDVLTDMRTARY